MAEGQRRGKSRVRSGVGSGEEASETSKIEVRNLFPTKPRPEAFPENKVNIIIFSRQWNITSRGSDADLIQGSLEDITGSEDFERRGLCS